MDQNDRRKKRRLDFDSEVKIKKVSTELVIPVTVFDLNSRGLGFMSPVPCDLNVTYESSFKIWTGETVRIFFEVVRMKKVEDTESLLYSCGAYFIGLSQIDAKKLEVYEYVDETVEGMAESNA